MSQTKEEKLINKKIVFSFDHNDPWLSLGEHLEGELVIKDSYFSSLKMTVKANQALANSYLDELIEFEYNCCEISVNHHRVKTVQTTDGVLRNNFDIKYYMNKLEPPEAWEEEYIEKNQINVDREKFKDMLFELLDYVRDLAPQTVDTIKEYIEEHLDRLSVKDMDV